MAIFKGISKRKSGIVSSIFSILGLLLFATAAAAAIVSGTSTTAKSADITLTQISINKPADAAAGDILVAAISVSGGSATAITPPTGWALILRTDSSDDVSLVSYWKAAGASEPASYIWSVTPHMRAVGGITRYAGIDQTNPIDASAGTSARGYIANTPSASTTSAGDEAVAIFAADFGIPAVAHFSTPAGMTEKYDLANAPLGPSIAFDDALLVATSTSPVRSSMISQLFKPLWVAQQITLRPAQLTPSFVADNLESYTDGATLSGLNGGTNWTDAWTGDTAFKIEAGTSSEGAKAIVANVPGPQEPVIRRHFSPKTNGTLHWVVRKDNPDHGTNMTILSGNTIATDVGIGSTNQPQLGGPDWSMTDGTTYYNIQHYTVGNFDTVDMQFDTATDKYRVSINSGAYTDWKNFANPVSSVDTIQLGLASSGYNVGNNYWDDIRFNN